MFQPLTDCCGLLKGRQSKWKASLQQENKGWNGLHTASLCLHLFRFPSPTLIPSAPAASTLGIYMCNRPSDRVGESEPCWVFLTLVWRLILALQSKERQLVDLNLQLNSLEQKSSDEITECEAVLSVVHILIGLCCLVSFHFGLFFRGFWHLLLCDGPWDLLYASSKY